MATQETLKKAFIQSVSEVFPLFQMQPQYKEEMEDKFLTSAEDVNVLISFSHTLEGNIVFGFKKSRALKVASLVKGLDFSNLDQEAKSALGEIATLVSNLAIGKFQVVNTINISPPILISGDHIFLMISRVKTTKLYFELGDDRFSISYCVEQYLRGK